MKSEGGGGGNEAVYVAPLVGAWIEIYAVNNQFVCSHVAPLVGAWIEMF